MALKSKPSVAQIGQGLTFRKRGADNRKKVLIYGQDGSGKSTYAEKYCMDHNLNPVVLDIEDTNYTDLPMLTEFDLSTDVKAYRFMKQVLDEIAKSDFDTIIIDGVDSLIESFISNANGMKCYADRSKTFIRFTKDCLKTGKNLIFVGQSPVDLDYYKGTDTKPNACIVKLNAMVNEKYRIGDKYKVETVKYRAYKGDKE
jgi:adenylate kinase family enzyme